jgi:hypothetical protein
MVYSDSIKDFYGGEGGHFSIYFRLPCTIVFSLLKRDMRHPDRKIDKGQVDGENRYRLWKSFLPLKVRMVLTQKDTNYYIVPPPL